MAFCSVWRPKQQTIQVASRSMWVRVHEYPLGHTARTKRFVEFTPPRRDVRLVTSVGRNEPNHPQVEKLHLTALQRMPSRSSDRCKSRNVVT